MGWAFTPSFKNEETHGGARDEIRNNALTDLRGWMLTEMASDGLSDRGHRRVLK